LNPLVASCVDVPVEAWLVTDDPDLRARMREALALAEIVLVQYAAPPHPERRRVLLVGPVGERGPTEVLAELRASGAWEPAIALGDADRSADPDAFVARVPFPVEASDLIDTVRRVLAVAPLRPGVSSVELIRATLDTAQEALFLLDADGHLVRANLAASRTLHDLVGRPATLGIDLASELPSCASVLRQALRATLRPGERVAPTARTVVQLPVRVGGHRWFALSIVACPLPGGSPGACLRLQDVDARTRRERQALHDANHDPLTGLPHRSAFIERLGEMLALGGVAVLQCDIDRFKVVNDSLGPAHGDSLLVAFADRLQTLVQGEALAARLGADEFAILEPGANEAVARALADAVCARAREPFDAWGQQVYVSASVGICVVDASTATGAHAGEPTGALAVLRDANLAMSEAKAAGGDRHATWDAVMHAEARARVALVADLRKSIAQQAFHLHFQPIVALTDGRVAGFEALVRWRHPVRGAVSPVDFIPLAEETGLIVPLSRVVLDLACRQLAAWAALPGAAAALGDCTVAVNASGRHFALPSFVDDVLEALRRYGVPPTRLEIEITESVAMQDADRAARVIDALRAHGIVVSIDDFGSGYSSLSYLHRLPVDTLKIDRSLICAQEEREWAVVRSIIALAEAFELDVVAEGVETDEQLARLRGFACGYGQGWRFARPMPADEAWAFLCSPPAL
jgi:diguanylate cyclase (GGDEF)-like protein